MSDELENEVVEVLECVEVKVEKVLKVVVVFWK